MNNTTTSLPDAEDLAENYARMYPRDEPWIVIYHRGVYTVVSHTYLDNHPDAKVLYVAGGVLPTPNENEYGFQLTMSEDVRQIINKQVRLSWMIDQICTGDYIDLSKFIPTDCSNVMDLGCGSGRVAATLNKIGHPNLNPRTKFWLVDGDTPEMKGFYKIEMNPTNPMVYNQRQMTEKTLHTERSQTSRVCYGK